MKRIIAMASLLVMASFAMALAGTASSVEPSGVSFDQIVGDRDVVLLIETTTTAIDQALNDLGVVYDYFNGGDFSGLDLTPYDHVFLGMDGGLVEEPSIANAANYVNGGGHFHLYGGTCYQPFAIAINTHLVQNDINNYCWTTVGGTPHSTIVDAGHYLATSLPANYNFNDIAATYYQTRTTDAGLAVAAVNGDGYNHLFSKPIGSGNFDWCINSAYESYYLNPNDYNWFKQVISNMLFLGPTATQEGSWSTLKSLY